MPVGPRRRLWLVALSLLGVVAGVGVFRLAPRSREPIPVVVLVSIDTLRPDHLGCYGYRRPTSPLLDALADEGVLFEDATSPSPWTLPAHASLLTGLYPSHHTLKSHTGYLPSRVATLATVLAASGYHTAAAVNSHNLSPTYGLDRGFHAFRYFEETAGQVEPSLGITDQAIEWLARRPPGPLFVFLHYYDVHSDYRSRAAFETEFVNPYDGPADGTTAQLAAVREGRRSLRARDAAHLVDLYDAGIRQMDDELGRLVAFLRQGGLVDRTLLIVTSDHGEEFLEHGGVLHGRTQFEEVVRVPLLVRGPGVPRGRRVGTPVSLVDVMPTVLALTGAPPPAVADGTSLVPLWRGTGEAPPSRVLFGEADHNNVEEDITRMARAGRYKLHLNRRTGKHELFDLLRDPQERVDVAEERPETQRLLDELRRFMGTAVEGGPRRELTPEQIEKLRSLGYVN